MIDVTPVGAGAARPWMTRSSVATIADLIVDGADPDDLVDLAHGAAELISAGVQRCTFWNVSNLFEGRGPEKWLSRIANFRHQQRMRDAARLELERASRDGVDAQAVGGDNVIPAKFADHFDRFKRAKARRKGAPQQIGLNFEGDES